MSATKLLETEVSYTASMYDMFLHKSGIRLGQHLCNTYGITDADVFYEEDTAQAMKKFREKYVLR